MGGFSPGTMSGDQALPIEDPSNLIEITLPELDFVYSDDEEDDEYEEDESWDYDLNEPKQQSTLQASKFSGRINLEPLQDTVKASGAAVGSLKEQQRKDSSMRVREKEKADRATCEQVLDPRTRMILFKLLNQHVLETINGCISTGKEANVYHGTLGVKTPTEDAPASVKPLTGGDAAIKVYKTSILVFKDRDRYVNGEFRFRRGYCKSNPRKMVKLWAEKEMRNLVRLKQAGIRCPDALLLRQHVLVMRFLGKNGNAAPKLKDVTLSIEKLHELYWEAITVMRTIYQKCKLVHADLSEYNILYFKGHLYIIDVSQAVEHDHPNAMRFLQMDCTNMTAYFRRQGVATLTVRELFDFITDGAIEDEQIDAYLEVLQERIANRPLELTPEELIDEEVFKQTFIPRTLNDVFDHERHILQAIDGNTKDMFYSNVVGLSEDYQHPKESELETPTSDNATDNTATPATEIVVTETITAEEPADKTENTYENEKDSKDENGDEHEEENDDENEDEDDDDDEDEDEETARERQKRLETMPKKERKALVKELKKEKRQNKVPKHLKKRRKKLTKKKS